MVSILNLVDLLRQALIDDESSWIRGDAVGKVI
jgi:hypothetical protein